MTRTQASGVGLGLDSVLSVPGVCCYSVIAEKLSASRVRFLKYEQIVKALYASTWHRTSRLANSTNMAQEELSQRRNFQLRCHLSLFRPQPILNSLEDKDVGAKRWLEALESVRRLTEAGWEGPWK